MRTKSLIFLVLLAFVGAFLLNGCKSATVKPATTAPVAEQQPQKPVTPPSEQPQAAPVPQPEPPKAAATAAKPAAQPKKGDVSFNFDDADIYSVIQTIFGDVLGLNYVVDPNVKGKVNFRSTAPIAKEDVLPIMEVILRLNGVGIVEEAGLYRIVPIADIAREPAPVGLGREPEKVELNGKALLQVIPIRYNQSTEIVRILTPFLSKNALIVDIPQGNYIVVVDTDANVKRLLHLIDIFDSDKLKAVTPQVYVYAVQNGKAKDVAALLQQIFLGGQAGKQAVPSKLTRPAGAPAAGQQGQPAAAPQPAVTTATQPSTGEHLVSDLTRIIPDEVTNTISILATPEDYARIIETLQKIDIAPRQVVIEGLIVQITLTDNLSFGISWSMKDNLLLKGLFPREWKLDGTSSLNPGGLDTTQLPSQGFTFVGTDPSGNVRAVLTALEDRSKAKVVAAPHILVSDNREARIQIGQQIPLATSTSAQPVATTTTTGTTTTTAIPVVSTSTIQYKDIGIILKVKPQINDSGLISLELSQEISSVGKSVQVGGLDEVTINKTEATSNLVARDGDTIIIGGLIREDTSHGTTGIPFLSKIPIIGSLFGNTSDLTTRTELIILLTPHVMRNQEEAQTISSAYIRRYKAATRDREIDKFVKEKGRTPEDGKTGKSGEPPKNTP